MGQFTQNGVVYEELPDGNVKVIGYAPAPSATVAPSTARVAEQQAEERREVAAEARRIAAEERAIREERRKEEKHSREMAEKTSGGNKTPTQMTLEAKKEGEVKRASTIDDIMSEVRRLYEADIKGQPLKRGFGALEYIDALPRNDRFRSAGMAMLPLIRPLVAQTAKEGDSDKEMEVFLSYIPSNDDSDISIESKFSMLERLIGGMVDGKAPSQVVGSDDSAPGASQAENELDKAAATVDPSPEGLPPANEGGNDPQTIASGDFRFVDNPRARSTISSLINAGAGYSTIAAAAEKAGGVVPTLQEFNAIKKWMKDNPGVEYPASAVRAGQYEPLTGMQKLAGSDLGAGLATYADTATAGLAGMMAGEKGKGALDAMRANSPRATLAGDIAGGITGALGAEIGIGAKLAGTGLAKFAPRLGDAAYGGTLGFTQANDGEGLQGAALGAGLGVVGGAVGDRAMRGVGAVAKGVTDPAVQYLRAAGIPLTAGQALGGLAKSVEDKATSTPIIGDMINKRRMEGLEAFDLEGMRIAGAPIGSQPTAIGREGIDQLQGDVSAAYDSAVAGANVPLDDQFVDDIVDVAEKGYALPDDLRRRLGLALNNRVNPINEAGMMTGESYQQAMRGLKSYKGEATKPGFEQDYRNALSSAQDMLTGQMMRGGGDDVVSGLRSADNAYRGIKTVEDAAMRADGANYVYTPSQLQDALKKTQRKFPGQTPLTELADMGQQVLPSRIADSGTAGRAAQMLVPSAIGGAAGGGYAMGDYTGAGAGGLGATLALMAGGTKTGQKALTAAILKRPDIVRRLGELIANNSQVGGAVATGALAPYAVGPQ